MLAVPKPCCLPAQIDAQCADSELDGTVTLDPRSPSDTYARAAVATLVQLAVAANSDVHWKPLNHQVRAVRQEGLARVEGFHYSFG